MATFGIGSFFGDGFNYKGVPGKRENLRSHESKKKNVITNFVVKNKKYTQEQKTQFLKSSVHSDGFL